MARYKILEKLGEGGMGVVFRALQLQLKREVAVKVLPERLSRDANFVKRFRREMLACSRLSHPNIIQILDSGELEGQLYYAMELKRADTLDAWMKDQSPVPVDACLDVVDSVLDALAYCHGQGIIHRDIKPGNVMIDADGHVTLMDFGLVKVEDQTVVTAAGRILGTPRYIAPEVFLGQPFSPAADVWALGIVLFEMLAGQPPFQASALEDLARSVMNDPLPAIDGFRHDLPAPVERFTERCLEKDPANRYPDGQVARRALVRVRRRLAGESPDADSGRVPVMATVSFQRPGPAGRTRARRAGAVLALAGLLGVVGWITRNRDPADLAPPAARAGAPAAGTGRAAVAAASPATPADPLSAGRALIEEIGTFGPRGMLRRLDHDYEQVPSELLVKKAHDLDRFREHTRAWIAGRLRSSRIEAAMDAFMPFRDAFFGSRDTPVELKRELATRIEELTDLVAWQRHLGIPGAFDPSPLRSPEYGPGETMLPGRAGRAVVLGFGQVTPAALRLLRARACDLIQHPDKVSIYLLNMRRIGKELEALQKLTLLSHTKKTYTRYEHPTPLAFPDPAELVAAEVHIRVNHLDPVRTLVVELSADGKTWTDVAFFRALADSKQSGSAWYRLDPRVLPGSRPRIALRLDAPVASFESPVRLKLVAFRFHFHERRVGQAAVSGPPGGP